MERVLFKKRGKTQKCRKCKREDTRNLKQNQTKVIRSNNSDNSNLHRREVETDKRKNRRAKATH